MGVAELGGADPLLLLLDPPPTLQGEPGGPFDGRVRDLLASLLGALTVPGVGVGEHQLEQAVHGLLDGVDIPPAQGPTELDPPLELL